LLLGDETLNRIGKKYNKSAAQISFKWLLKKGIIPIIKAVLPEHVIEDANVSY
jgi:diketogulonate reductase-like aldo/keto reductase